MKQLTHEDWAANVFVMRLVLVFTLGAVIGRYVIGPCVL